MYAGMSADSILHLVIAFLFLFVFVFFKQGEMALEIFAAVLYRAFIFF